MNKEQAAALLRSLAERVRTDAASGAISVEISLSEKRALEHGASWLVGEEPLTPPPVPAPFSLNLASAALHEPDNPEVLLCLDFGTAMSKAFARRLTDDELLPLAIGQRAGQADPIFGLISSVYVSPDGRLLFGQDAVSASHDGRAADLRRIDSFKDMLAKGDPGKELGQAFLDAKSNPTSVMLREIDVLALYLAYLTDMAVTELAEKHGVSRYVRRRFTLPVFDRERSIWAKRSLRDVLARAQVLADTFHGRWKDGILVVDAKAAVNAARQAHVAPVLIEEDGVTEPMAAISSRVHGVARSASVRQLFAVVDVGAGTIDFALFYRVPQKEDKPDRFFLIPGTEKVLRQAGNQVDNELAAFILQHAGVRPSDHDFARIESALALDIRLLKEDLFRGDGTLNYKLEKDREGQITRQDFLNSDGIRKLEQQIHRKFEDMIASAHESWFTGTALVDLVALVTGGGADLPFVRSLEGKQITRSRPLSIRLGTARPPYIETEYQFLSIEYPRLAVALGGSSGKLPELAPQQFTELGASQVAYHLETVPKGI
jgi:molecular chaperone DnaK (HSP70)